MNSKHTGKVRSIEVSADNIRSWIETGLRSFGAIKDDEIVIDYVWEEGRGLVPVKIKKEEVEILRF